MSLLLPFQYNLNYLRLRGSETPTTFGSMEMLQCTTRHYIHKCNPTMELERAISTFGIQSDNQKYCEATEYKYMLDVFPPNEKPQAPKFSSKLSGVCFAGCSIHSRYPISYQHAAAWSSRTLSGNSVTLQ